MFYYQVVYEWARGMPFSEITEMTMSAEVFFVFIILAELFHSAFKKIKSIYKFYFSELSHS